MKLLASGLLLAAWASAQPFEIRGVAMEPGTNHMVDDAEVTIRKMGPRVIGTPVTTREVGKRRTDAQGRFVFRPDDAGEYILTIQKEGFGALTETGLGGMRSTQINVVLTNASPGRDVQFTIARSGEMIGRIVDYETGAPRANVRVLTHSVEYRHGQRLAARRWDTRTDSDGRFRALNLAPGKYIAEIDSQFSNKALTEFSAADVGVVDEDYEHAYFPGGPELDSALPVQVAAGTTVDLGTYRARKSLFYRAVVSVSGADCVAGSQVSVQVFTRPFVEDRGSGVGTCGKPLLIPNLAAGSYGLSARTATPTAPKVKAEVPLTITNKNVELLVTLARSPDLTGQMVRAEGARKIEWEKLQLQMFARNTFGFPGETAPIPVDAEGRFRFENRLPGIREIYIVNLPSGTFVKQMRYRGIPLSANIFNFTGEGQLEIEIDDRPSVLAGSVRNGDKPVEGADAVLIRWPMDPLDNFDSVTHGTADDDGKFQFSNLPAGEYRVLALSPENRGKLEEPGVLQRVLPSAEKVTLNRGGAQTATLMLVDPLR